MKTYMYYELPGAGPGKLKKQGSLMDLLQSIPYLFSKNRLPPLTVLNSVFESGGIDAGMSGGSQWAPFSIEQQEYFELIQHCRKLGLEIAEPPPWVENRSDFLIWEFELDHGVPSKKHKELSDIESVAHAKLNAAMQSGTSEEEVNRLHLEAYKAGHDLSEFIDRYLQTDNK